MRDHYKALGATPLDSTEKIKGIYRTQSQRYRNLSERDQKNLVDALRILSDEDKRKEYDSQTQFQIKKNSPKLVANMPKKKENEKKPFRWGIPIMEIIMMPFKGELDDKKEEVVEETAQVHFTQGVLLAEDPKRISEAIKEFEKADQMVPGIREVIYNLGIVLYRAGRYKEAYEKFKKCTELESKDMQAKKMMELLSD